MRNIAGRYRVGFSVPGMVGFAAVMLPNIIWMLHPPANDPIAGNASGIAAVDAAMSAAQWLMIALLVMIVSKDGAPERGGAYVGVCAICLALYYVSWRLYYGGVTAPVMLIGMAVEPSIFFIALALLLRNVPALVPAVIFGLLHTAVTIRHVM